MLSHDGADREQHDEMWTMRKATSLTSPVLFDLVSLAAIVLPVTCTSLGLRPRWLLKRIVPHDCTRIHHACQKPVAPRTPGFLAFRPLRAEMRPTLMSLPPHCGS